MPSTAMRRVIGAPRHALVALVRAYRFFVSPALPASCRFEPSCSAYALAALDRHGAVAGTYLAVHRVVRCGPWCPGGLDPVPARAPRFFGGLSGEAPPPFVSKPSSSP